VIAVVHAYSRANAGDGLLVDLTLARLASAGVTADEITLFAMDQDSFADLPHVAKTGTPDRAANLDTLRAAVAGLRVVGRQGPVARLLEEGGAFVAVGGGYLRSAGLVNSMGTGINHLPTLAAVARSGAPSLYLPQSVGPLSGPVGRLVRRMLRKVGEVHVRDDRSVAELGAEANVRRTPDLAVLHIADTLGSAGRRDVSGEPVLVARALSRAPTYDARLHALARLLGPVTWAVQSEGSAAKSDRTFYDALGMTPHGRVGDVLAGRPGPVVSVRLHGALQAILAGVPAIHLGYERKSWGAFEDLGIPGHVHSARRFDPDAVAAQVRALQADPSDYWAAIEARIPALREASEALTESLRTMCAP
jgi:polysaccharide pyruvyl transferase WcaK-like protein